MPDLQYAVDEYVLCFHGPLIYEARVLLAENWDESSSMTGAIGPHYFVHYKGWKQTWDEWVPESRVLKLNEAGFAKQRTLLAAQSSNKRTGASSPAPSSAKGGATGTASTSARATTTKKAEGKKRGRESGLDNEGDYLKRPEVKIVIPDVLKLQLVDDWEYVTKNNQLVSLPRNPNVREVLEQYKEFVQAKKKAERSTRADSLLTEIISGLTLYFDKALGNNLLYRFERPQLVEQRRLTNEEKPMSEIYGAEHLLRLFVNFGAFIAYTNIDTESLNILREHINDILRWMIKEKDRIFLKQYETTTAAYQTLAKT